ncbi:hypothetical protein [Streptomyces fuscigenes]|uniref:hypothetical protein n=1 Tax=Streptomyces fuscigenes TaxID=1528880 RepID=UPI001F438788|nr:hypothetical protein [Streptomyces fuscigenes]MCF3960156.1 hypothetical protein [Streptomyces fuscigenes]
MRFQQPLAGAMTLRHETLTLPGDPGRTPLPLLSGRADRAPRSPVRVAAPGPPVPNRRAGWRPH